MNSCFARIFGAVVIVVLALTGAAGANAPAGRDTVTSETIYDSKTKLTWQQNFSTTTYTWAGAKSYCAGLGGTSWRLPTGKELLTIVDYSLGNPSIDPTAFPSTPASYFWSSSPLVGDPSTAWSVLLNAGDFVPRNVSDPSYVRCVR